MMLQMSWGNAAGSVTTPTTVPNTERPHAAFILPVFRRTSPNRGIADTAINEARRNIHPRKCIAMAGNRRTNAAVPPPATHGMGARSSITLPTPSMKAPAKAHCICSRT